MPVYARLFKRWVDVASSLLLIALFSPILVIAAVAIQLEDGGPAVFRQTRVGRNGRTFTIYKFRSMPVKTPDVPSVGARALTVTRVGRFIRRTNIDELPQLFNVLRGDMSLIGPRPALPTQTALLQLRESLSILSVRPGLTGLAQVNSFDGMSDAEKAEWESRYIRRITFLGDLAIAARTAVYVLRPPPVY